jgi:hypothetical protein
MKAQRLVRMKALELAPMKAPQVGVMEGVADVGFAATVLEGDSAFDGWFVI